MRSIAAALMMLVACAGALPATAQVIQPRDEIVLVLAAEEWVETKTARVVAVADVAIAGESRNVARDRMMAALKKLSSTKSFTQRHTALALKITAELNS